MSVRLRREQECSTPGCSRPAHIGELCVACFYAATPARRATELNCQDVKEGAAAFAAARAAREADARLQILEALFAAPCYGEAA